MKLFTVTATFSLKQMVPFIRRIYEIRVHAAYQRSIFKRSIMYTDRADLLNKKETVSPNGQKIMLITL